MKCVIFSSFLFVVATMMITISTSVTAQEVSYSQMNNVRRYLGTGGGDGKISKGAKKEKKVKGETVDKKEKVSKMKGDEEGEGVKEPPTTKPPKIKEPKNTKEPKTPESDVPSMIVSDVPTFVPV